MKKPSGEVFSSLGKYVYGYKNPSGTWDYVGKGVGDRLWHHVSDKDLDPENVFVFARNLETFDERTDASQFSVESILMYLLNPSLNKVSKISISLEISFSGAISIIISSKNYFKNTF